MIGLLREQLKKIPFLVSVVRGARRLTQGTPETFGSADYWEQRYAAGGNSGAGSYNRLARFKADFLNYFVAENNVSSVIEFGCGDGAQLALADYPSYIGVDVSPTILAKTAERFADDRTKRFVLSDVLGEDDRADAAFSLDVIYHLIEDTVFDRYMRDLFDRADRYVVIYSNDVDTPWNGAHVRNRKFSTWIERNRPGFDLIERVANPYPEDPQDAENTSIADFFVYRRAAG